MNGREAKGRIGKGREGEGMDGEGKEGEGERRESASNGMGVGKRTFSSPSKDASTYAPGIT